ncbi:hypothetical protein [Pengzhenrongella sicca]|uniref:Uncharacterized protein n=1 Tax=Pengzhenrongella sicca TaxID=2819238 RepID=A0A8A4ZGW6_9MICO|nr:hypothetical protein [Pengzhenrongella sicca]QTE29737.1 hypothetical protein J4E96_01425 [Pengzhenrongella sicca]
MLDAEVVARTRQVLNVNLLGILGAGMLPYTVSKAGAFSLTDTTRAELNPRELDIEGYRDEFTGHELCLADVARLAEAVDRGYGDLPPATDAGGFGAAGHRSCIDALVRVRHRPGVRARCTPVVPRQDSQPSRSLRTRTASAVVRIHWGAPLVRRIGSTQLRWEPARSRLHTGCTVDREARKP